MDKGTVSNWISALLLALSIALPVNAWTSALFTASVFAFSGGITNWLAVKMLFDRVPGLVGSGVIPARFREIRAKVKDLILEHFFNREHLDRFFEEELTDVDWGRFVRSGTQGSGPLEGLVLEQWEKLTGKDVVQPMIDSQLEKLTDSPIGGMLLMVGLDRVRPAVNQFVTAFVSAMQGKVEEIASSLEISDLDLALDREALVDEAQVLLDRILVTKLERIHAHDVKRMMEDVMRQHLGWLVVWGNVFGALIGLAAHFVRPLFTGES